jgi:hypothetical protein
VLPSPDITPEPLSLRHATATDLPAIKALIDAAYARYLTRMDKPPGPMLRDYGPSVGAGTTWLALSCLVFQRCTAEIRPPYGVS